VLTSQKPVRVPWQLRALVHIPVVRDLPGRLIAFGPLRVHLLET